jgi:hypothetical protein
MAVGLKNFAMENEENARHLGDISFRGADAVFAEEAGPEAAEPDLGAEKLGEIAFFEAEGAVQAQFRVPDAGDVGELVAAEDLLGGLFAAHMDEDDLCAGGFDVGAAGA